MFIEDQLLPISALQHLIFCPRLCALIHLERLWAENRWTIEGRHLHEKAHSDKGSMGKGVRIARGLQLHSLSLVLFGQADVVDAVNKECQHGRGSHEPRGLKHFYRLG